VLIQVRDRLLARRPMRIEAISIGQIDVQPSVIVVVEKSQSASLGFNNEPFSVDASPDIRDVQSGLLSNIHKLNRRRRGLRCRGFYGQRILPLPKWSRKSIRECAAEHEKRRSKETASRKDHRWPRLRSEEHTS